MSLSVSTPPAPAGTDGYYSPWRIRALLPELARSPDDHLERRPRPECEPRRRRQLRSWWPLEEAACVRADLASALGRLPWFTRQVVFRAYVLGDSDRHLATVLGCDRETVRRHRLDGLELMAWQLGYRDAQRHRPGLPERPVSATTWRKDET